MSKIKLPHASGNSMSIAAPATNPASDLELKLPATIGTAGQVLQNSSTPGTLEFASANAPSVAVTFTQAWGISSGGWYLVPYNSVTWDTASAWTTVDASDHSNGSVFTVPSGAAGKYVCSFGIGVDNIDDNEWIGMRLCKNGATSPTGHWADAKQLVQSRCQGHGFTSNYTIFVNNTVVLSLADDDKIQPQVYQNEGAGQLHNYADGHSSAHFSIFRLGGI